MNRLNDLKIIGSHQVAFFSSSIVLLLIFIIFVTVITVTTAVTAAAVTFAALWGHSLQEFGLLRLGQHLGQLLFGGHGLLSEVGRHPLVVFQVVDPPVLLDGVPNSLAPFHKLSVESVDIHCKVIINQC